jgi:hypothetical protein
MDWDDEQSPSKVAELDSRWEKGIFDISNAGILMDWLHEGLQLQCVHYIAFYARSRELMKPFNRIWMTINQLQAEGKQSIKDMESVTSNLRNLLAQSDMGTDVRIGAMVALVELEIVPDECTTVHSATLAQNFTDSIAC